MMESSSDLHGLRFAVLQHPEDSGCWQALIAVIEALGAGLLLSDLDGLFEQPLTQSLGRDVQNELLQRGLEAHRSGDAEGLRSAQTQLQDLAPDGAWAHALQGLLAEMEGASGYAAFARALALEPADPWFRYWLSVACLRRRDWIDFSCQALLLAASETREHQVLVLAATYHLIAAVLVRCAPELCQANDLRVFDLVHPDAIPHSGAEVVASVLRFVDKERRKMIRILIVLLEQKSESLPERLVPFECLVDLLRWRIRGLAEPCFSADLYAALQRQLDRQPVRGRQHGDLLDLLPSRPDLMFGPEHGRIWRDFRFTLMPAQ